MSVESISALMPAEVFGMQPLDGMAGTGFSEQLFAELSSVNRKMTMAETALHEMATGKPTNIHHVMLALEDAKLSFQLLAQVRAKLLEGYQEILRMQV